MLIVISCFRFSVLFGYFSFGGMIYYFFMQKDEEITADACDLTVNSLEFCRSALYTGNDRH